MITLLQIDYSYFDSAYNSVLNSMQSASSLIMFCQAIAVIIIIVKAYNIISNTIKEGNQISVSTIFEFLKLYIYATVAIILAPIVIHYIEIAFKDIASAISASDADNKSTLNDIEVMMQQWRESDDIEYDEASWYYAWFVEFCNTASRVLGWLGLVIEKMIFYIFLAGRYLYLIILQCMMPFAIVFAIDKETRSKYTEPFIKNLFCCYMLIPAFLIANNFAASIIDIMSTNDAWDIGTEMPRWIKVWCELIFKFYLYGKSAQFVRQIF